MPDLKLAPIVLFVYNRPWHTEQTLNALMANALADQSVLYIFSDGPRENANEEDLNKIKSVRDFIRTNKWCKEVHIVESEINKGLADSIIAGVSEVINRFGKVVVLEDDIVTSTSFLSFMNEALDFYQSNNFVAGISGFKYPSVKPIPEIHFLPIGSSWGWATWKRQWSSINFDTVHLLNEINARKNQIEFDFGCFPFFNMLEQQEVGKINSWAIRFYASFFLQKKCFGFPPESMVQNIGFDPNATHTRERDEFMEKVKARSTCVVMREAKYDNYTYIIEQSFKETYRKEIMPQKNEHHSFLKMLDTKIRIWLRK